MSPLTGVVGIFAKWPAAGRVKTRLGLPPDLAARVARAFVLDTVARVRNAGLRGIVVYSPAEARADFETLLGDAVDLTPQADGDLGARLEHFFEEQLRAGVCAVVAVGADSPTLPVEYVDEAFRRLESADVVLGPATDGGYYLLGCRRLPGCFTEVSWGGPSVLAETVARLDPSWKLALLPPWYDVDTPEGWAMLGGHLLAQRRAGIDSGVRYTEALIHELPNLYSPQASSRTSSET